MIDITYNFLCCKSLDLDLDPDVQLVLSNFIQTYNLFYQILFEIFGFVSRNKKNRKKITSDLELSKIKPF